MIRCKFMCVSVTKRKNWNRDAFVYEAEFTVVTSGSEENRKFLEATPSGSIKIGTYKDNMFEPGKAYFLDMHEADDATV